MRSGPILPKIDEMIGGGMVTIEPVEVVMYRHHEGK
jgi:PII-like signaling protein